MNRMRGRGTVLLLAVCGIAAAELPTCAVEAEGWDNVNPFRVTMRPGKVYWAADLANWPEGYEVRRYEGAEGDAGVVERDGSLTLRIRKTNDRGWIVITPVKAIDLPAGTELQSYAYVSGEKNDPEYAFGFLRLLGKDGSLSYFSALDGRGPGGPKMNMLVNTAPGVSERKLCRYLANDENGTSITPAIVVAGTASESFWKEWGVEDLRTSMSNWSDYIKTLDSRDHSGERVSEAEFDSALAMDRDHTACVETRDGAPQLLVDGVARPPVLFKGQIPSGPNAKNTYCGRKMEEGGINLQVITVRFGDSPVSHGWWTKDGFDAKGAAAEVRSAMRLVPGCVFLLTMILDAYPEFTDEHPSERWIAPNGLEVWGNQTHANYWFDRSKYSSKHWPWVSYSSRVWLDAAKRNIEALVDELRAQGLSKRIVGCHIGGYHDHQFATQHPDFSPCAVEGFKRWQKKEYGRVRWESVPKYDPSVWYFKPGRDDHQIAYYRFLKLQAMDVVNEAAKTFKTRIGKPVIAVRWCMGAFHGTYGGSYDIGAFARCDSVDVIAPQADYQRRTPGLAIGARLPMASFRMNNKLMFNEFDLRTYGGISGNETELRVTGLSQAIDDPMWCSTYRKCAGQQFAAQMGWWFYDMAGGWFEPEGIASDIADSMKAIRAVNRLGPAPHQPVNAAYVVDEDGYLLRNMVSHAYNYDEETASAAQRMLLAGSGVPYDIYLLSDLLRNPSVAARYRTLVFAGLYAVDEPRRKLLEGLRRGGRTLVYLTGAGVVGGAEAIGFDVTQKDAPQSHRVAAEKGVDVNMLSACDHLLWARFIGGNPGAYWQPRRISVVEKPGMKVLARYEDGGDPAVVEFVDKGSKSVYICDAGGLTPQYFNRLVCESGGYAPAPYGLQVDMNGRFVSLHCVIPGHYDFKLPRRSRVLNLKTRKLVQTSGLVLPLDLKAGETRWYALMD